MLLSARQSTPETRNTKCASCPIRIALAAQPNDRMPYHRRQHHPARQSSPPERGVSMTEREKLVIELLERAKIFSTTDSMRRKIDEAIVLLRGSSHPSAGRL